MGADRDADRKGSRGRQPISLAVLNGADTGKVLRTGHRRISVGSAPDNDLVLGDADVSPRHFVLLVEDDGGWKAQTYSPDQRIVIDRRWSHPKNGRRGALIYAGGTEILLFPGDLDDRAIQSEIKLRASDDHHHALDETAEQETTIVAAEAPRKLLGAGSSYPPSPPLEEMTVTLDFAARQVRGLVPPSAPAPAVPANGETHHDPTHQGPGRADATRHDSQDGEVDATEDAEGATIAADRLGIPAELRDVADDIRRRTNSGAVEVPSRPGPLLSPGLDAPTGLIPELSSRAPVAPSVLRAVDEGVGAAIQRGADGGARGETPWSGVRAPSVVRPSQSAWDRGRKRGRGRSEQTNLPPEIVPEIESKMAPVPGGDRSVMARPSSLLGGRQEARQEDRRALAVQTGRANAWGDTSDPPRPSAEPRRSNAWGDAQEPQQQPPPPEPRRTNAWGDPPAQPASRPTNAWGDPSDRASRSPPATIPQPPPEQVPGERSLRPQERGGGNLVRVGAQLTSEDLEQLPNDPALTIVREPDGSFATATRLLGTRLEEMVRTFGYRAYMLTSPEPLTGKTTIACNLAFALAEDPVRRVALIEANFRYPRIGEILGADRDRGLIGVLAGQLDVSDSIVKVADRNLVVFPAGGRHPNPAELLASPRFKTLLTELAETVDIAIIDAPAVKPFADTNLLLPLVDAALLVVLGGSTKSQWISQAVEQLGRDRVLGSLYNGMAKAKIKALQADRRERLLLGKNR